MLLTVDPTKALSYSLPILLASVISLGFSLILYYLNLMANNERGKIEFFNEVKSIIFNVIMFGLIIASWSILNGLTGKGSLVEEAKARIDSKILPTIKEASNAVTRNLPHIASLSSLASSFAFTFTYRSIGFKSGSSYQSSAFSVVADKLYEFYSSVFQHTVALAGLKGLMEMFEFFAITFFIPLGVFLRTFRYTRRLGSTMVSIGIGAGIVLPIFVYLGADVFEALMGDTFLGIDFLIEQSIKEGKELDKAGSFSNLLNLETKFFAATSKVLVPTAFALDLVTTSQIPIISDLAAIAVTALRLGVKFGILGAVTAQNIIAINYFYEDVASSKYFPLMARALIGISVALYLFYFVVAASVISFIRSLSITLGGEFFLYGVERLI